MATSDPCANAPPTPPEEPEPSPSPRKKRGRRKLDQTERNKGIDVMQSHIISNMTLLIFTVIQISEIFELNLTC